MTTNTITARIDNTIRIDDYSPVLGPPHSVKIELSRTCNYKCSFCYHSQLAKDKGRMDWDLYTRTVKELKDYGVKELAPFFFGESFLDPRLPDAIRYAKDIGFEYVFLTTNGSLATPDKVEACFDAGLDSLKFSLNYADEEQFSDITKVHPKWFRRVVENIKAARAIRDAGDYSCRLYASYIDYTDAQKEKMASVLAEVGPCLDESYALPLYSQAGNITRNGWTFSGGNQGRADNPVPPIPCWALFKEAHINFDGTVCACCFSVSDAFVMGDLNESTFAEIWNGEKFRSLRQSHLNYDIKGTPCEGCIKQV